MWKYQAQVWKKGTFNKFAVDNTTTSNTITIGDISNFKRIKICDNRNV